LCAVIATYSSRSTGSLPRMIPITLRAGAACTVGSLGLMPGTIWK
jgi:hypothetical protein